ncbi:DUF6076 domain-containing protein [bacterium]|nr:DUF6076 domain-containing protein [bacterium]
MSGNLLQTEDKYSTVSFGFAPNRWHMTDDEKSCVLSVNDEYNYSKLFELFNAIDADKREAIALAVTGKKEFALSDGEIAQIKQDTADTLARLRAVTQKINSAFDFLPMGDSRAYISPMNTSSVFFSPGEGILNFLYADFDSAYNECLNRTKKDLPTNEANLDISSLPEEEKKLYYYLALTQTQKRFKPLIDASLFTAEFPPILLHCSEQELTDYYQYLKEIQSNLLNLIEATFDENFCDGFFNHLTHKTRFAGYCRKLGLPAEQKRTIVHSISIIDAEHQIENVLDGYIDSDFDLNIKMAAVSDVDLRIQKDLDKLGFTMPEMIALSVMQADEYETCICESIEQQIEFELIQLLKSDTGMRKCKRCGKYFIMKGNYDTNYCDRIAEGETRNCQDLAAQENYKKKMADNAAIPLYQKYYKRYAARVRVRQIKETDFKKWKYQAMTKRDECSDGKITLADFEEWLEASFPNRKKK